MNTPIYDFVREYQESRTLRLHMPGHKGKALLGMEELDLTEIAGADSLYEADSIIRESEDNASSLFGCPTFYSTEGSSQCIRAMLRLVCGYAREQGKQPVIAAGRNAHKTFLTAAILLDFEPVWLTPETPDSYLSCLLTPEEVDRALTETAAFAVYLTNPDYLGNCADIAGIARVCHAHGALLLVDNAHGAYLHFLPESMHPMDLGADLCCASAHKTLPALTGAAYLHIAQNADPYFVREAKNALALFGSTSPSYLILQSLDAVNRYLAEDYRDTLAVFVKRVEECQKALTAHGYACVGNEPMKLTISAKSYGYTGTELAAVLRENGMECEFADPDFLVAMLTPETGAEGLERLTAALLSLPRKNQIPDAPPVFSLPERVCSPREAAFAPQETLPARSCAGRILAQANTGCPPAVPIVVCGERLTPETIDALLYYGIEFCTVVR
ncbi:MAG: aminotransferase class V-fold PLP-dependent enzyme [Clostridia bacterium]|nr:aminotransferase class V-fold PLP-dependent enzyme [Clostridia bacterium]